MMVRTPPELSEAPTVDTAVNGCVAVTIGNVFIRLGGTLIRLGGGAKFVAGTLGALAAAIARA
jgi:hypothetical protein